MEEWGFVDERDLQNWKGGVVCMTCQHFIYGVDQHCRTMVGCNLSQKQLQQGEHLNKRCKPWAPISQAAMALRQIKAIAARERGFIAALTVSATNPKAD